MSIEIPGYGYVDGMGSAPWVPVLEHLDLLGAPVREAFEAVAAEHLELAAQALVTPIDSDFADTEAMTSHFGMDLALSSNCVLIAGKRSGQERIAAAVIRATTNADVNHCIKKLLDVRKCSFMPMERAVEESGMEYGGITPIGLPPSWRLLLDTRVAEGYSVIGSGLRTSKLAVPGALLAALPGAEIVDGLAVKI